MQQNPVKYSFTNRPLQTFAFRVLAENYARISKLRGPLTLVDLGCGTGNLTKMMTWSIGNVDNVYGLDISKEMINIAEHEYPDPRIKYSVAQAEKLDTWPKDLQGKKQADMVTMFASLHYFEDPKAALLNTAKVLRPGGLLLGYTAAKSFPALVRLQKYVEESHFKIHYKDKPFFRNKLLPEGKWIEQSDVKGSIKQMISDAKLTPIEIKRSHGEYIFREDEAKKYVVSFVERHANCVPLEQRPQFETECYNVFAEEFKFNKQGSTIVGLIEDLLMDFAAEKPK